MILPYTSYRDIQQFNEFFRLQSNMCPSDREKSNRRLYSLFDWHHIRLRRLIGTWKPDMAKKKAKFEWKGYVNVTVSETEATALKTYMADDKLVFQEMSQVIVEGYTIKIYYDDVKANFRASLTCYKVDDDNYGFMLGAFADDWYTALVVLLFKHYRVAKETWSDYQQQDTRSYG